MSKKVYRAQRHITLLPAWGYDPLQPGDLRGSQWGWGVGGGGVGGGGGGETKDNNRFYCLKSGPLKGPAWLGIALCNDTDSNLHGANMGPIWGQVGPMLAPWTLLSG